VNDAAHPDVFRVFMYQRAIRTFTEEAVPDELVHQVLTAAIHGPSGSNSQPWHFILVRDPTVKQAMRRGPRARRRLPGARGTMRKPITFFFTENGTDPENDDEG
jgi:nitroreductase